MVFPHFSKQPIFHMSFTELRKKIFNGKNPKFVYYAEAYAKLHLPRFVLRPRVEDLDRELARRPDRDHIVDRVNYYCKASAYPGTSHEQWLAQSTELCRQPLTHQKVYYLDSMWLARFFDPHLRWHLEEGDVDYVPQVPSIVKSRPIAGDNSRSTILKLDLVRHFIFVNDHTAWRDKQDRVVFRGKVSGKAPRIAFLQRWAQSPRVDAGSVDREQSQYSRPKLTLRDHLRFRYIMAIEGNDVASNLKWVMSSNSIAVMPRPTCETWFMEGRLKPDYHYIEVKPDFSDLEQRLDYYSSHPDQAQAIIAHAHEWVAQFRNARRERLIALLVLRKYFDAVAQL